MASKTKAATVAAIAVILALLAYSAVLAPAVAQTQSATSTSTSTTSSTSTGVPCVGNGPFESPNLFQGGRGWGGPGGPEWCTPVSVSVGQTITLTSTKGEYRVVGDANENGTASGTLTFTVTGSLRDGYTLSLTNGSIVVGGTTYTVSSGSGQLSTSLNSISGQGTTTPTGVFIVQASAHGTFVGSTASVSVDLSAGSTEYLVSLAASIQG